MAFDSWQALLAMGGHGPYVWSAYAVTLLVMAWLIAAPVLKHRRLVSEICAREQRLTAAAGADSSPGVE